MLEEITRLEQHLENRRKVENLVGFNRQQLIEVGRIIRARQQLKGCGLLGGLQIPKYQSPLAQAENEMRLLIETNKRIPPSQQMFATEIAEMQRLAREAEETDED